MLQMTIAEIIIEALAEVSEESEQEVRDFFTYASKLLPDSGLNDIRTGSGLEYLRKAMKVRAPSLYEEIKIEACLYKMRKKNQKWKKVSFFKHPMGKKRLDLKKYVLVIYL